MFVAIFAVVTVVVGLVVLSRARQARWEAEDEAAFLAAADAADKARFEAIMASYEAAETTPAVLTKDEAVEMAAKYF